MATRKKQPVEAEIEALHALRHQEPLPVDELRAGLRNTSNAVVAKAAAIVAERQATELASELSDAAQRFFTKADPRCMAKLATVRALKELDHVSPELFQRALRHVQMEPSFGPPVDTAGPLRAIAALGLSECRLLSPHEQLNLLIDALPDPETLTRIDILRAIGQVGCTDADAVLRAKARLGDEQPEVTGQCLLTLIERDSAGALPFVASFLDDATLRIEAAMAIAAQRGPEALSLLQKAWARTNDRELLLAIGTLRTPEGAAWLIELLPDEKIARQALEPCRHLPGVEDALA